MKIVHISDTHVGSRDGLKRLNNIINTIMLKYNPNTTIVVHTGDVIDSYSEINCGLAQNSLKRLTQAGFRILLCPGNHDYGNSFFLSKKWSDGFRAKFSKEIFNCDVPLTFPVITLIEDVMFIGLDTSERELRFWETLMAEGDVGPDQRAVLQRALDTARNKGLRTVVYMHHNPFINGYSVRPDLGDAKLFFRLIQWFSKPFRRLKDAYSLMNVCRDKADILLFGHQHIGLNHKFEAERYGLGMALDGSSSTCKDMDMTEMHIRVIDTDTLTFDTLLVEF